MSESRENRPPPSLSTSRIEAFSDGVFAVAITLLVLNLQVPQISALSVSSELISRVSDLWPKLVTYALSFVIVGIYWVAHHNTFHYIKHSDRNLLWLNILLLLCIVFIPFPTALLGQYPLQGISVIIYGGTLMITGLALQLLWWYATSHCLVDKAIDPHLVRRATHRNLMAPLIYLFAVGISFLSVQISLLLFVVVPVLYILPGRIDQHWTSRSIHRAEETKASNEGEPVESVSSEQEVA